jgi:hypothetical protein
MATAAAIITMPCADINLARAQLAGEAQAIVDLYERNPEQAYRRLAAAVATYEDALFADRANFWAGAQA